jgi:hypothetical protein
MTEQTNFRRFDAEKQEQIQQLIGWARLLGLTGRDLISIGGKLDRATAQQELRRNKEIALGMWNRVKWIGVANIEYHDPDSDNWYEIKRSFVTETVDVRCLSAPKETKFTNQDLKSYHCGASWRRWIYRVLVNIHYGDLKLPG